MEINNVILKPSCVTLLAGTPVSCKTCLAMNIAEQYGLNQGKIVSIFSLEQTATNLSNIIICSHIGLNIEKVITGKLSREEKRQFDQTKDKLKNNIFINDTTIITPQDIAVESGKIIERCGSIDLIIIDYCQLMTSVLKSLNSKEEIIKNLNELDAFAKKLNVPILVLFQLPPDRKNISAIEKITEYYEFNGQWLILNTDYESSNASLTLYNGKTTNKTMSLIFDKQTLKFVK